MHNNVFICRAPYRVSFFGGGTDYQSWYQQRGGIILSTAIDHFCYVSLRALPPFYHFKTRVVQDEIEEVNDHRKIEHPIVRHSLGYCGVSEGVEIHIEGDLPSSSGLGSSSALTVALLGALRAFQGERIARKVLTEEAIFVEQSLCRMNVGVQDQIAAAFGGLNLIQIEKSGLFQVQPLLLAPSYLKQFESHFLLGFTGLQRNSSAIAGATIQAIHEGTADHSLSEIMDLTHQGYSLLKSEGSFEEFGKLLHQSWICKRNINEKISNPWIDSLYKKAIQSGAWGGKLSGAGAGGFVLLMAPPEKHNDIKSALPEIRVWVNVCSDPRGVELIVNEKETKISSAIQKSASWRSTDSYLPILAER